MYVSKLSILFHANTYVTVLLALTAVIGDYFTINSDVQIVKAICDNITHAIIGGICWSIYLLNSIKYGHNVYRSLIEIIICSISSSGIDLDHFLTAKSLYLKDATSLKHRPFLHCSTLPLCLFLILILLSVTFQLPSLKKTSLLVLTAFISHHIRDAQRRGFWFCPFGSTRPLPYLLYVIMTCLIPHFILLVDRLIRVEREKSFIYDNIV